MCMLREKNAATAAGCALVAATCVLLLVAGGCKRNEEAGSQGKQTAPLAVTFCHGSVTDILPRIALEQGYFAEEGLTVTLNDLDGKLAFDGMLAGECNFAVSGAPPIVLADPRRTSFAILATVLSDYDSARIIARRDLGIATPQDLRGKRIGVKKGVLSHIFLDLFMMKHGLEHNEVVRVFMEPEAFRTALAKGEIDGFSMTNRMVDAAATALGDTSVVFAEPGLNPILGILTTRPDIPLNLQATPRLLHALIRAEQFVKNDPAAAKALVAKENRIAPREIESLWARTAIDVALPNFLFIHLEDQYRWQVERGGSPGLGNGMPNYLDLVLPEYLRAIKPDAVTLFKR
ncbi:MAG: ABC transporter substrate-binding protein [Proteobacteria bacterium]|nr:ABC transporter substrate-binding protein [Pseudomonadota bacterium]MBU1547801.1 ABC transporter substrate-binding protein [Pseudomonadota bacterium]MBU2618566.1 ABC transporter substrate-binding protein [Pseudomonadota bacterium]